ncbi:MAG: fibrobacter succinogenes major paralogous domain-containing protein [Bacteroidota bacterium]|nr:fibrobacter succinogenes major paralogous domain-containing protein [Bacteroidota bacterium]
MKAISKDISAILIAVSLAITSCDKSKIIDYTRPLMPDIPSVVTSPPEDITTNTADLGGFISYNGGGNILASGISIYVTGISSLPGSTPAKAFDETRYSDLTSDEKFAIFLSDLKPNATYHYRAFATNEAGTAYGDMKILVTSYGRVSDREGNQYQTIQIGDQIWMRENLKTGRYPDGTTVTGGYDSVINFNYGKHYSWQAAKGTGINPGIDTDICPDGWHVPSDEEWQKLLVYTGIPKDQVNTFGPIGNTEALDLKDSGSNFWKDSKITNSTGFSALPAGVYSVKGNSNELEAAFWTSTPYIYYGFQSGSEKIVRGNDASGNAGFSVRCIKN